MWYPALLLASALSFANDGPGVLQCETSVYFDDAFDDALNPEDDDCPSYVSTCQNPLFSPSPDLFLSFVPDDFVWFEMDSQIGLGLNMNLYMLLGSNPGFGGTCGGELLCIDWEYNNGLGNGQYTDNFGGTKIIYGTASNPATYWFGWDLNETVGGDESLLVTMSCCFDTDGDGAFDAGTAGLCPLLESREPDLVDCDDSDPENFPLNTEICDGQDNNCNGVADENLPNQLYYRDQDGDGYGVSTDTVFDCGPPPGYTAQAGDCDDLNPAINPGRPEITCNNIDDDCNIATEDRPDIDQDGADACIDCDDSNPLRSPNFTEVVCNGIDDDCSSATLDAPDNDRDGVNACEDCNDGNANISPNVAEVFCNDIDDDCNAATLDKPDGDIDGVDVCTDCDDSDPANYPGNTEICDGQDNDCDTLVDDADPDVDDTTGAIYYADTDEDSFGDPDNTIESCSVPDGYVTNRDDCDDNLAIRNPDEAEVCDGIDNDCDPTVDEGTECYDDDGDGFTELGGDCDDASTSLVPTTLEVCDGIDNDCDSRTDEDTNCYDDDGDGYCEGADLDGDGQADDCRDSSIAGDCSDGDPAVNPGVTEFDGNGVDDDCNGAVDGDAFDQDGDGYLASGDDCIEDDATAYPGAPELPDGLDNDCDDEVDEGTTAFDDDGDGVSEADGDCNDTDAAVNPSAADAPGDGVDGDCDGRIDEGSSTTDDDGDGYSEEQGDCNDADALIYPGADEVLNGVDDDCDGEADDGLLDADGDGFSEADGDCNDADGWMHPERGEICDGQDNDCDGVIDEDTCGSGVVVVPPSSGCNCEVSGGTPSFAWLVLPLVAMLRRRVA